MSAVREGVQGRAEVPAIPGAEGVVNHPERGTCVPDCPMYGICHCGCGRATNIADQGNTKRLLVRGRPFAYVHRHAPGSNKGGPPKWGGHGCWSKNGVPVEKIRPLADWLWERYGSWGRVAAVTGIPTATLKGWRGHAMVGPKNARLLIETVLYHRRGRSSIYDEVEDARLLPRATREAVQRELEAENKRKERAGKAA